MNFHAKFHSLFLISSLQGAHTIKEIRLKSQENSILPSAYIGTGRTLHEKDEYIFVVI